MMGGLLHTFTKSSKAVKAAISLCGDIIKEQNRTFFGGAIARLLQIIQLLLLETYFQDPIVMLQQFSKVQEASVIDYLF